MSDENDLRNQIEALLFSSGRAMSVEDLSSVIELEKRYVKKSLVALKEWYDSLDGGLMVIEEGDSWKLSIKEKYVSMVTKIVSDTELSKTVLETLSVIAWKSPVLQSEVIKIRTTNAYDHIKELVDAGFITKEKEGRSYKLKISEKFYEYFDVPGDKGIKAAFEEVKIPEKKEPEEIKKIGDMDVVPVDDNSVEHGKTAQIFGTDQPPIPEGQEELAPVPSPIDDVEDPKSKIPPIDDDFLDRLDEQIGKMTKKNDDIDNDDLFKRKPEEQSSEDTSATENEPLSKSKTSESVDEDVDETAETEDSEKEKVVDEYEESTKLKDKSDEKAVDEDDDKEKNELSDEDDEDVETPEDENAEKELDDESTGKLSEELEESEKELDSEIEDEDSEEEDEKKEDASTS